MNYLPFAGKVVKQNKKRQTKHPAKDRCYFPARHAHAEAVEKTRTFWISRFEAVL